MLSVRRIPAAVVALVACAAIAPAAAQASWTVSNYTVPGNTSQGSGVACPSTTLCIAVGSQSGTTTRTLATKWNGTSFSSLTGASTTSELAGIGCASTTFCLAVGTDYASGAVAHAETFNGTSWTNRTAANPSGSTQTTLQAASCPSSTVCYVAGSYTTSTATLPVLEAWNGTSLSIQSITLPAGATNAELLDVSCSATNACTAVGYYDAPSVARRPLVYRWNGTSWALQTAALPTGATLTQMQGVACLTSTNCQAVGVYTDSLSVQHSLGETWNGTAWSLKTIADPSGGTDPALYDIACYTTPSTGCSAVGGYTGATSIEPLAANYNGTSWSLASVPKATGVSDATLSGIACASGTVCMADGVSIYDGSAGITGVRPAIDRGP
jgi:hypothetical protein